MRLIRPKVLLLPPSTIYVATVHGTAGKADQGYAPGQLAAHARNGVGYVLQFPSRIRHAELVDIGGSPNRPLELGAFAGFKLQPQIHGMGNREDVGKQNRGIERIAIDRLQGDFAGDLGIRAHFQKAARARARRPVFGQIPAGLAHQPDRPARRGLAQQGAQQQIVLQRFTHECS